MSSTDQQIAKIASADRYKVFVYVPEDAGKSRVVTMSRQEVLDEFFEDWCDAVHKTGRGPLLNLFSDQQIKDKCIYDWVLLNYAVPEYDNYV